MRGVETKQKGFPSRVTLSKGTHPGKLSTWRSMVLITYLVSVVITQKIPELQLP